MSVEYEAVTFERLGHASVRIETPDGRIVYVDPWEEVIDGEPHDADLVFVTHDDFDHYDPDAIAAVSADDTAVVVFEGVDTDDLDGDASVRSVSVGGELAVSGIEVRAVAAYNRSDGDHVDDDGEPFHAEGDGIGVVLSIGDVTAYYVGDSDVLDEHESVSADVLLPPIGGHYTMDRHEAASLVERIDPDLVLPVHYDTFEAIETDAEAFKDEVTASGPTVRLF
ncbi:MBL fold metallo-hydrolase [Halovivax gelatinilyticus]|uniref:MBL fold metallo-hydrolase n=1 Tax=Halovivax gelatinilyticus TaxID=2961597 RepID=UPI0020CA5AEE|nr:MBL fold metallo-hydrolase [Halovivax gelatinilyticus]